MNTSFALRIPRQYYRLLSHKFFQLPALSIRNSSTLCLKSRLPSWSLRHTNGIRIQIHPIRCLAEQVIPPKKKPKGYGKGPVTWKSFLITLGFGAFMLVGMWYVKREKEAAMEVERKKALGKAAIGGEFNLIDHTGKPRSSQDFKGQWALLYFGFSHCPDICPDEMEKMVDAVNLMKQMKGVPPVQMLFITVDPDRDDVKTVAGYIKEFSPDMIGLTGTREQVQQACKAFRVYFSAGPKDEDMDYIVDHTIIIYLINPDGEFVDYFGQNMNAEQISSSVAMNIVKYDNLKSR